MHSSTAAVCPPLRVRVTRSLLGYGVLAGPLYVVTAAVQAGVKTGYDPLRHDVSLLANGGAGWIQTANFVVTGLMVIAAAVGMARTRHGLTGPVLVGGYGAGLALAGVFPADPAYGFPPGTPAGPAEVSWHGLAHLVAGGLGFLALVAACLVFAGRFARRGQRGRAWYSAGSGVVFLAGFAGIAAGPGQVAATVAFTVAVVVGWAWLAVVSAHLYGTEVDQ
ncbi:hypothetical membrane protein [Amycolatopsis sacchari]|uniref:Hypothetical membrane protein n=1 Tax=Amycolatopsis sacchari TaxID=115433 RepID=A0A1I3T4A4_9PSEU|nr:DUF998 domain-containing protein [Amycolatopsis sacchari]SFJ65874.1 hypothetical membrane protein [Amycolatopsis sacchari]